MLSALRNLPMHLSEPLLLYEFLREGISGGGSQSPDLIRFRNFISFGVFETESPCVTLAGLAPMCGRSSPASAGQDCKCAPPHPTHVWLHEVGSCCVWNWMGM